MSEAALTSQLDWQSNGPYAPFVQRRFEADGSGIGIIEVEKPAGDYPDPPVCDLTLIEVVRGRGQGRCDFGAGAFHFEFAPGTLVCAPPGTQTQACLDSAFTARFWTIPVSRLDELLAPHGGSLRELRTLHAKTFGTPLLLTALRSIWDEMREDGAPSRLLADVMSSGLIASLWREATREPVVRIGGLAPWQLKRACEAMDAHLGEEIGLDMLAEIAGCSPTHFSRAFKQSTGIPPFQWLLERRIECAQALLADRRVPLAQVALAVGFAAQPQFTTAFRRVTGVTPGTWRRERTG